MGIIIDFFILISVKSWIREDPIKISQEYVRLCSMNLGFHNYRIIKDRYFYNILFLLLVAYDSMS